MTQPIHDILNQLGVVIFAQLEAANDRAVSAEADYARLCDGLRKLVGVDARPASVPANDLSDAVALATAIAKADPVGDAAPRRTIIPDQPFLDALTSTWQGAHAIRKVLSESGLKVAYGTIYKRMDKLTVAFPDMIEAAVEPARWRLREPSYVEPAFNKAKSKRPSAKARVPKGPPPANDMPPAAITDARQRVAGTAPPKQMFAPVLYLADCLDVLKTIPDNSVHLCVTDPPYFLHHLGDEWTADGAATGKGKRKMCRNLRSGMKYDRRQGQRLQSFMADVSVEIYRVLVPGAFFISFSQARLYHRLAIAVEDAGFEIRDMLAWKYEGQPKAMSMNHFVESKNISQADKARILDDIGGRKTAMLKPMLEPMTMAQKPCEGTHVENWLAHRTGLIDVAQTLEPGRFPGNVMTMDKPTTAEKGEDNDHPTVKPVPLIEHLIRMFSAEGQTVLDPFLGSGSHGVAAVNNGRRFIGIERDPGYHAMSSARINGMVLKEAA